MVGVENDLSAAAFMELRPIVKLTRQSDKRVCSSRKLEHRVLQLLVWLLARSNPGPMEHLGGRGVSGSATLDQSNDCPTPLPIRQSVNSDFLPAKEESVRGQYCSRISKDVYNLFALGRPVSICGSCPVLECWSYGHWVQTWRRHQTGWLLD